MKINHAFFILCAFLLLICGCSRNGTQTSFYISPSGSDNNPGTKSRPFATFEKARDAVRNLKKIGESSSNKDVKHLVSTIYLRGGTYIRTESLILTAEDSGTESAPVIWSSYNGEKVVLSGGRELKGFAPVTDPAIINRLDPACRDSVMQCDLKAQGIGGFENRTPVGTKSPELFFKGKSMTLARYPNDGWLRIANVPQTGERMINKGLDRDTSAVPRGRHYGRFTYEGDRPNRWKDTSDIWMLGYWVWDWAEQYMKIDKIDLAAHDVYPTEPHHGYGYQKNQRFFFLNILEELDSPGEWYLDRKTGILYFWPPSHPAEGDIVLSLLSGPMISLDETSFIDIRGLILENTCGDAVVIKGGSKNRIAGCTIHNTGDAAVRIPGGTYNGVQSCEIFDTGSGGIYLDGGDRPSLTPANNYADNNHIHHYSRLKRTYQSAVELKGVGNRMSHNLIHDAPHLSINLVGNDHIIEYNEIHHVNLDTGDAGAINFDRDWTERGNVVRHNYFHHIEPQLRGTGSPQFQETMGIYLDAAACGLYMYGNVFYRSGIAIFINGGRDNTVENNIFVECEPAVFVSSLGIGWAKRYIIRGGDWRMYDLLASMPYTKPPWSTKYPALASILDKGDETFAAGNVISRNISYGGTWLYLSDGLNFDTVTVENNLISGSKLCRWQETLGGKQVLYNYGDSKIMEEFAKHNNTVIETDPGFVDAKNADFHLKADSPALKLGFKPIPFEKIGMYGDEFRK